MRIQKKKDKNATETSHEKFSEGKQAHVGMEALKTTKLDGNQRHHNTFTPSLHLVSFCQLHAHHKTLYMHLAYLYTLNNQGTQFCSLQSYA